MTVALVQGSPVTGGAGASWLDSERVQKVAGGEIVVEVEPDTDGGAGIVRAAIDIAAPPPKVWAAMVDCERTPHFVAGLESCHVLSRSADGSSDVREHRIRWAWPLPEVRSVFRSDYIPYSSIRFSRLDGDLRALEGAWHLEPIDRGGETRLTYEAHIDPGLPLPGALVRGVIASDVEKVLSSLRAEVDVGR